jgi:hypothetical protein
MPEDNDMREVTGRAGTRGEASFDELAKGLASGTITRVQALKLAGAAILGAALASLFPGLAFAQDDEEDDGCGPASEACGGTCCGPTEECCAGTCCEIGFDCVDGWCVCSAERIPCGSDCCDPVLEECGDDGLCHNWFCEECWASGGNCSQQVENGVLLSEACCAAGEAVCTRGGEGTICCPAGYRCPDADLGEAFACVPEG